MADLDLKHPWIDAELHEQIWGSAPEGEIPASLQIFGTDLAMIRKASLASWLSDDELRCDGRVEFEELTVEGYDGGPQVPVLVLRPTTPRSDRPALVYTGCGGKMMSAPRALRGLGMLQWVVDYDIVLVSVGLRVGPEDPHPAQVHDGYAGLRWVAANSDRLGVDPRRIGLAGISGGGGVAAATALFARDHGGPDVAQLIALTPMLDDRDITVSNHFEGVCWPHDSNITGWTAILGEAKGGPEVDQYAAPARALSLHGLPPTYIETGSADTFRDESLEFALRAGLAGVPVEVHSWAGYLHGCETYAPDTEMTRALLAARLSYLRRVLGTRPGLVPNVDPRTSSAG
ncbi:alpha/beta hydrolase [Streptomyces chartreusis]|uniref:alpha/beta hydrolase n=1 Tax=Streptomyces chartreusis TaxID=1969 RepID=UPI00363BAC00